jgi:hypothetical protein
MKKSKKGYKKEKAPTDMRRKYKRTGKVSFKK